MPEDMPDTMSDRMPEDMPDRMPEDLPDRMPEHMPDRMPNRMSEDMSDRMPEDLPVRKCINFMVAITRSKVFLIFLVAMIVKFAPGGMVEFFKTIKVVPKLMSDCSGCECAFWALEKVMPKSKLVSSHLGLIYQSFFLLYAPRNTRLWF